jgi:histidinol-phosphate aminotransferase
MNWLNNLVRPEILELAPYSSARSEYKGAAQIQLDANEKPEKPYGQNTDTLNRYPEPQPLLLRQKLADMYAVSTEQLLITRGMDEGIDLLIRLFCLPYKDTITILPPTFRYYEVCAKINAINIIEMPLSADFSPNWADLQKIVNTKLIFLCTPNNPTGNLLTLIDIKKLCDSHAGRALIAVDEAYIEFANTESAITLLPQCENLVVMRTLSKAYGLAGARLGTVITHPNIIVLLQKIIPPYPIPTLCSEAALVSLSPIGLAYTKRKIAEIKQQRAYMAEMLLRSADIQQIYKSEGNFLLLIAKNADSLYQG